MSQLLREEMNERSCFLETARIAVYLLNPEFMNTSSHSGTSIISTYINAFVMQKKN